ncbi:LuxR C-terminal-related transcriptional regulator [Actinoplanes sp. KI2]|uniref:helix-turn-helix domain-containing protein n=1 Tax=Actinoplanes sp. KI2 TaxID=2983315 RepID=UPI0021D5BDC7|nr:LuxR C-terminal-related transcriptional regulator [Actinoplanes sp. KI2]MCU7722818.1 LuxR C-terminal-related transcriptional regulator [Actinoplanes sp. KI2]
MVERLDLLPASEEQAYRLLMRMSGVGTEEFAARAGIGPGQATELLAALQRRGLVTPGPTFHALPPDVALGEALLREQEALESARRLVAALGEEYRTSTRRRSADHLVEIVVGAGTLRERLRDLQDSAREEILWFSRANPLAMPGPVNTEEKAALARGVRYRAIYERALLEKPAELAGIVEAVSWGEQARVLPLLPVRLAVADRELAICPLVPDAEWAVAEPTAAVVRSSELLAALVALFESYWDRATPLGGGEGADEPDKLLLSLVVAGMPDKSIATHLGVSKRTVQRRLDRMMGVFGVDSRAGLAFQAAKRGWL